MSNEMIFWSPGVTIDEIERQVILKAYKFYQNNKTTTASALGIAIRTLDSRLEKYKSDDEQRDKQVTEQRAREADYQRRARGLPSTVSSASAGSRVESPTQASSESQVPVSQRQEVQKVLPQPSAQGHSRRAR